MKKNAVFIFTLLLFLILPGKEKYPPDSADVEDIEKLAFYDISTDFTIYMKKSSLSEEYKLMRKAVEEEICEKSGKDIFSLQALVFARRFDEFTKMFGIAEKSKETEYLEMLALLFASDFENYQKKLSTYLSKYKDGGERAVLVRYYIMSSYIADGEVFFQYYKKNMSKVRLLASIIGRETPLMYEIMLSDGKYAECEEIRKNVKNNPLFSAELMLIDYRFNKSDSKKINEFVFNNPTFPLNNFLMELK